MDVNGNESFIQMCHEYESPEKSKPDSVISTLHITS